MNQAIQFPDREEWRADINAICFPALVNGVQLMCAIDKQVIARRFGGKIRRSGWRCFVKIAGIWKRKPAI